MLNPLVARLTRAGLSVAGSRVLEVRGRRTGEPRRTPVNPLSVDGVQSSPRYPGGLALRFARVLRHRPDKRPEEADTIDTVRAIHAAQG